MDIKESYDNWSEIYDTNDNKTRDLEAQALKETIKDYSFENCLEIGCGTGKNTLFLISKAKKIIGVDFSEKMLEKAKQKIQSPNVNFVKADITKKWDFLENKFDFIGFSLVLEHIENLDFIFQQIKKTISENGYVYIGELHPFKQYSGSKARFETETGIHPTTCFTHNISDFTQLANKYNLKIESINEFFDDNDKSKIPRIISIFLRNEINPDYS